MGEKGGFSGGWVEDRLKEWDYQPEAGNGKNIEGLNGSVFVWPHRDGWGVMTEDSTGRERDKETQLGRIFIIVDSQEM